MDTMDTTPMRAGPTRKGTILSNGSILSSESVGRPARRGTGATTASRPGASDETDETSYHLPLHPVARAGDGVSSVSSFRRIGFREGNRPLTGGGSVGQKGAGTDPRMAPG